MILWPHQAEAIEVCTSSSRRRHRSRTLVQFPTGTGKTEVAVQVAVDYVTSAPFRRCLIAVSSDSVLQQFYKRLCASTTLPIGRDKAGSHAGTTAKIIVGSRASTAARSRRAAEPGKPGRELSGSTCVCRPGAGRRASLYPPGPVSARSG